MIRRNEEPQGASSVSFRVPDFVDADGIEYADIEVVVERSSIQAAQRQGASCHFQETSPFYHRHHSQQLSPTERPAISTR
jgi:hypothetical protein